MIEQQARVIHRDGSRLQLVVGPASGCPACEAGQGCGAGLFGKLLNRKPVKLELTDHSGLQPGQLVQVGLPELLFLKLVLSLYGLPLFAGLGGAAMALALSGQLGFSGALTDLLVLVTALLVASMALKIRNRTLKPEIDSELIRIMRPAPSEAACSGPGFEQINEVKK